MAHPSAASAPSKVEIRQTQLIADRAAELVGLVRSEEERLAGEWSKLDLEKEGFDSYREKFGKCHVESPLTLNIGGQLFKTTLETLKSDPDSFLCAMFTSTGFAPKAGSDGAYFIDRDGTHFRHILNFLRGVFEISVLSTNARIELRNEADFYQIRGFLALLKPSRVFSLATPGDKNGLFYWLGTKDGLSWVNPAPELSIQSTFASEKSNIVNFGKVIEAGGCNSSHGKSITIQLPQGMRLAPSGFTLTYSNTCCKPANFLFEGAWNDGAWTTLYSNTTPLTQAITMFPTQARESTKFRLTCSGSDSSGTHCSCFHICNLELYGELFE